MFKKMPVCRLMISCPSDIKEEVDIINKVVENINDSIGLSVDMFVKTLYWSKNVMPEAGDYPQSLINKQILDKADAIIAIFGNKIGSPTQKYESGTIEEIELMVNKGKHVFVYFSEKPVRKNEINFESEQKIQEFKNKYKDRGIYAEYTSDIEFSEIIRNNLTQYLMLELSKEANYIVEHTRFDEYIAEKKEVDLFYDYMRYYQIKAVNSKADPKIMNLSTYKKGFDMEIKIPNILKQSSQEFAMALLEYTPCDNWSAFFSAGYFLEFDAVSSGHIKAFQLEIKNDIHNKIIDKIVNASSMGEHVQIWLPSTTRDMTSWEKVAQICFTVFFNDEYISGAQGVLSIRNFKMLPQ